MDQEGLLDAAGPWVIWVAIAGVSLLWGWVMVRSDANELLPENPPVAAAPPAEAPEPRAP